MESAGISLRKSPHGEGVDDRGTLNKDCRGKGAALATSDGFSQLRGTLVHVLSPAIRIVNVSREDSPRLLSFNLRRGTKAERHSAKTRVRDRDFENRKNREKPQERLTNLNFSYKRGTRAFPGPENADRKDRTGEGRTPGVEKYRQTVR